MGKITIKKGFWISWKEKAILKFSSPKRERILKWFSISIFYILLVGIMTPGIGKGRVWKVGDIPEGSIKAPYDFSVCGKGGKEEKQLKKGEIILQEGIAVTGEDYQRGQSFPPG